MPEPRPESRPEPPLLDDLIAEIIESADLPEPTFAALLDRLYHRRYSGAVVLHFDRGQPRALELPRPSISLRLSP